MSSTPISLGLSPADIGQIVSSKRVVALTGAGISAESGLATFRGKDGIWAKMKPQELASIEGFMANPALVREWYQHRRDMLSTAKPASGHIALVKLEQLVSQFTLVTQNVDGLHAMAGSQSIVELHGNIRRTLCFKCGAETESASIEFRGGDIPRCHCGGALRPGVVWFGEPLPEQALESAIHAAMNCDLFLTIGTSAQVYPAASLPEIAIDQGAIVIEINTEETSFTPQATHHLRGSAGELLSSLVNLFENRHESHRV